MRGTEIAWLDSTSEFFFLECVPVHARDDSFVPYATEWTFCDVTVKRGEERMKFPAANSRNVTVVRSKNVGASVGLVCII